MTTHYLKELNKKEKKRNIPKETLEMFEGYRTKCLALFYPFVFFVRRYAILLVLILLSDYRLLQIMCHILATGFVIQYIIANKPQ